MKKKRKALKYVRTSKYIVKKEADAGSFCSLSILYFEDVRFICHEKKTTKKEPLDFHFKKTHQFGTTLIVSSLIIGVVCN